MKRAFVVAFAVSTLLRPSLVLCMEPTGDVRVERQEAVCCDSEHAVSDVMFRATTASGCEGCLDIGLVMDSRTHKRVSYAPAAAPAIVLPVMPAYYAQASVARCATTPVEPHRFRVLSTTIIRR